LTEYLYQNGLAYFHTPSAVLRNQIEDLLNYPSEMPWLPQHSFFRGAWPISLKNIANLKLPIRLSVQFGINVITPIWF
jgi:hypothetical protein